MMVDKNLLKGKIVSSGYTQESAAKLMGISKNTLCAKINGHQRFYSDEVLRLCKILGIDTADELAKIFYPSIPKMG